MITAVRAGLLRSARSSPRAAVVVVPSQGLVAEVGRKQSRVLAFTAAGIVELRLRGVVAVVAGPAVVATLVAARRCTVVAVVAVAVSVSVARHCTVAQAVTALARTDRRGRRRVVAAALGVAELAGPALAAKFA